MRIFSFMRSMANGIRSGRKVEKPPRRGKPSPRAGTHRPWIGRGGGGRRRFRPTKAFSPAAQRPGPGTLTSGLAAFGLQIYGRVAGTLLALARFGEKAMHVVSAGGGQLVLDAPDFLKRHVASAFECSFFRTRRNSATRVGVSMLELKGLIKAKPMTTTNGKMRNHLASIALGLCRRPAIRCRHARGMHPAPANRHSPPARRTLYAWLDFGGGQVAGDRRERRAGVTQCRR